MDVYFSTGGEKLTGRFANENVAQPHTVLPEIKVLPLKCSSQRLGDQASNLLLTTLLLLQTGTPDAAVTKKHYPSFRRGRRRMHRCRVLFAHSFHSAEGRKPSYACRPGHSSPQPRPGHRPRGGDREDKNTLREMAGVNFADETDTRRQRSSEHRSSAGTRT